MELDLEDVPRGVLRAGFRGASALVGYEEAVDPPDGIRMDGSQTARSRLWYALFALPLLGLPLKWSKQKRKLGREWHRQHGLNYVMRGGLDVVRPLGVSDAGSVTGKAYLGVFLVAINAWLFPPLILALVWIPFLHAGARDYRVATQLAAQARIYREQNQPRYREMRQAKRAETRETIARAYKWLRRPKGSHDDS